MSIRTFVNSKMIAVLCCVLLAALALARAVPCNTTQRAQCTATVGTCAMAAGAHHDAQCACLIGYTACANATGCLTPRELAADIDACHTLQCATCPSQNSCVPSAPPFFRRRSLNRARVFGAGLPTQNPIPPPPPPGAQFLLCACRNCTGGELPVLTLRGQPRRAITRCSPRPATRFPSAQGEC